MLKIGVLTGAGDHDDILRQLAAVGAVHWLDRADALIALGATGTVDAVVTGLRDEAGRSVAPLVVELAAKRPSLPVVLHTRLDRLALDELLAIFAPGLSMECVIRPFAPLAPTLERVLAPCYRPGVVPLLLQHFVARAPAPLALFLAAGALSAADRRSVQQVASWTRLSSRTIERRLRSHGWAFAHVVLQAFSALDAIWLMTEYGWSARLVHEVRRFTHPSAVTRLLASYAGTSPATLAADGGFPAALEHVTRTLAPSLDR